MINSTSNPSSPSPASQSSNYAKLARSIDKILLKPNNFIALCASLSTNGYWIIPPTIWDEIKLASLDPVTQAKLQAIKHTPDATPLAKPQIFQTDVIRSKFCYLKIKEINSFILEGCNTPAPSAVAPITLSVLEHSGDKGKINVSILSVQFDSNNLATSLAFRNDTKCNLYNNTLEALTLSEWLIDFQNESILRFADRTIEDKLSIKLYCKNIEYAVSPSTKTKDGIASGVYSKGKNFWERFASEYTEKNRYQLDEYETRLTKHQLKELQYKGLVILEQNIKLVASKTEIQQHAYVEQVLRINRSGMGSLLYLPTGIGKTFIILLSLAQHYTDLLENKRKPYIIVVGAANVFNSWIQNLEFLKSKYEEEGNIKLFGGKDLKYWGDEDIDKLKNLESKELQSYHIVLVMAIKLKNTVASIFTGQSNDATSAASSSTSAKSGLEPFLSACEILKDNTLVIGTPATWKTRVRKMFDYICTSSTIFLRLRTLLQKSIDLDWKEYFLDSRNEQQFVQGLSQIDRKELNNLLNLCHLNPNVKSTQELKEIFSHLKSFCCLDINKISFKLKSFNLNGTPDEAFQECFGTKNKKTNLCGVFDELSLLQQKQTQSQDDWTKFMDKFNGVIADESHALFAEAKKSAANAFNPFDILREMSDFYQSHSVKGANTNKLVIAASATPWPNKLDELRLHLLYLAPKVMNTHGDMNTSLFKYWAKIEESVRTATGKENEPIMKQIQANCSVVITQLLPWIRVLFEYLVVYESHHNVKATNDIIEQFLYIKCDEKNFIGLQKTQKNKKSKIGESSTTDENTGADGEEKETGILKIIGDFYSGLVGVKQVKKNPAEYFLNEQISDTMRQCLEKLKLNPFHKFAFYLHEQNDAEKLKTLLNHYFTEVLKIPFLGDEIALFYDEIFTKKSRYNSNRNLNKNAFNNEFYFDDYMDFVKQRLIGDIKIKYIDNGNNYLKRVQRIYLMFQELASNKSTSEKLIEADQIKVGSAPTAVDQMYQKMLECYNVGKYNYVDHRSGLKQYVIHTSIADLQGKINGESKESISTFTEFMQLLIEYQTHSTNSIVHFDKTKDSDGRDWLAEFCVYIPTINKLKSNKSSGTPDEHLAAFREWFDNNAKNGKISESMLLTVQYSFIYYIHKMYLSRIFIFGQAGTSGMRIDADQMFMFSGAWTEGKLTQIKGRFGRRKCNMTRKCIIHAPLTNSSFEYFILKYYVLKFLYDRFITGSVTNDLELIKPIYISELLINHYAEKKSRIENFINDELVSKVQSLSEGQKNLYFSYTPLEKAACIVPAELKNKVDKFLLEYKKLPLIVTEMSNEDLIPLSLHNNEVSQLEDEMGDVSNIESNELTDGIMDSNGEYKTIDEQWDKHYPQLVLEYIQQHGYTHKPTQFGGTAQEVIQHLIVKQMFTLDLKYTATNILVHPPEIVENSTNHSERTTVSQAELNTKIQVENLVPVQIPLISADDSAIIEINQQLFDKFITSNNHSYVLRSLENGVMKRFTYEKKLESFTVSEIKAPLDYIYLDLTTPPDNRAKIKGFVVENLTFDKSIYVLYAYVYGGSSNKMSHYRTMRLGENGYYICDDSHIKFIQSYRMPIHKTVTFLKFARKDLLPQLLKLTPKGLQNFGVDCYINASYQLVDSIELRSKIENFIQEKKKNPASTKRNRTLKKTKSYIQSTIAPAQIEPLPVSQWTDNDIKAITQFCNPNKFQLIFIVPTRGQGTDLTLSQFSDMIIKSCLYISNIQIILLFGTNAEMTYRTNLENLVATQSDFIKSQTKFKDKLYIKDIPFLWGKNDHGFIPYGRFRQFCLQRACELFNRCDKLNLKFSLCSGDGDTEITRACLNQCIECQNREDCLKIFGFEVPVDNQIVTTQSYAMLQANEYFFGAVVNQISMNISSDLVVNNNYAAYPAEPFMYLSSSLTRKVFTSLNLDPKQQSLFGNWDLEGRIFASNLQKLCNSLVILPPDPDPSYRPILRAHETFKIESPLGSRSFIKQQLSKEHLLLIISKFGTQRQHLMKDRFLFGILWSQLKRSVPLIGLIKPCQYFTPKNILKFLGLGPERTLMFAQWLRNKYVTQAENSVNEQELVKILGISLNMLENFNKATFGKLHQWSIIQKKPIIFDFLTRWLCLAASQLVEWFSPAFEEEICKKTNLYVPMQIATDYPVKVEMEAVADDDNNETLEVDVEYPFYTSISTLVKQLNIYFIESCNYSVYPDTTPFFKELTTNYPDLKYVFRSDNNLAIAVLISCEEYSEGQHRDLLSRMQEKCKCLATSIDFVESTAQIKLTKLNQQQQYHCESAEMTDEVEAINEHWKDFTQDLQDKKLNSVSKKLDTADPTIINNLQALLQNTNAKSINELLQYLHTHNQTVNSTNNSTPTIPIHQLQIANGEVKSNATTLPSAFLTSGTKRKTENNVMKDKTDEATNNNKKFKLSSPTKLPDTQSKLDLIIAKKQVNNDSDNNNSGIKKTANKDKQKRDRNSTLTPEELSAEQEKRRLARNAASKAYRERQKAKKSGPSNVNHSNVNNNNNNTNVTMDTTTNFDSSDSDRASTNGTLVAADDSKPNNITKPKKLQL